MTWDSIVTTLHIISSVEPEDRLACSSTVYLFEVQKPSPFLSFMRWFRGESRAHLLKMLQLFFMQAFTEIDAIYNSLNETDCLIIRESLRESKRGLENLKRTYMDDVCTTSQLQLILSKIDQFIIMLEQRPRRPNPRTVPPQQTQSSSKNEQREQREQREPHSKKN